uniref:Uncharacterized protein n=1 Tax=Neobodo designis TaxID=312471 RepID=A0A7S1Q8W2_NEODS|mmetsp:Transcript_37495/g.115782  ORF Transcript_37495/g.115782 Transcript_37495/m.115782 type:complete len:463 (+) Transcript_37495:51-1439(+)
MSAAAAAASGATAAAGMLRMAPTTARQARLLRLANTLSRRNAPGAPKSEADRLLWVRSHERKEQDTRLSTEEESIRARLLPTTVGNNAVSMHTRAGGENLYHFREYPMFPGEYVPPEHNVLASVRDSLRADLTAQSVKDAWMRVSGGNFFGSPQEFYASRDGLNEDQLADIVNALFPDLSTSEAQGMVRRILEAISSPSQTAHRTIAGTISADALGLDDSPGHYSNFLQWMSRISETKAFATEHSIYQFCRRAFNREDVVTMWHNYHVLSPDAVRRQSADGYSHFYSVLRDYSIKVKGTDTRHQRGVRIDPREVDPATGFSFGYGRFDRTELVCMLRPNREGRGTMTLKGKPIQEAFGGNAVWLEQILAPFDEARLNVNDFDVHFYAPNEKQARPEMPAREEAIAAQFGVANAITRAIPLTRIPLKKAGYLSFDRTTVPGDHPGFRDMKYKMRPFFKRARKS